MKTRGTTTAGRPLLVIGLGLASLAVVLPRPCAPQEPLSADELRQSAPTVFLDCHQCDMDYIRTEITFVTFVRERRTADVHILVTIQQTGPGGREYTLSFIGHNAYYDIRNTLKYVARRTDTADEERKGFVRVLKMGLVPYAAKTALGDFLYVNFERQLPPAALEDIWNFWVFNVGLSGNLSGEKSRKYAALSGWLSANRVTAEEKLRLGLSASFNSSDFVIDDQTITSSQDSQSFSGIYVRSLNEHWSVGSWLSFYSSSYSNIAFSVNPAPAVEYNFFPYAESTRRQLRLLYRVGFSFNKYQELTIYDKLQEALLGQTLSMTLEIKEPWGNISSSLQGSHLLSDFSKNRLEFWGSLNLHLFRGLSLSLHGSYSRIHDQVSLPKAGASLEEVLLRQKMLATNYNYGFSVGLSYTFGSIYSNVVNPRFGR
ncbi:MAG: hypothetical protein OEW05_07355 [Candidatus Aminicenantes bacterium]|nr:hypothetical protein [Candidatus Aminicenantes bacterium]